jgi:hypothetical protein
VSQGAHTKTRAGAVGVPRPRGWARHPGAVVLTLVGAVIATCAALPHGTDAGASELVGFGSSVTQSAAAPGTLGVFDQSAGSTKPFRIAGRITGLFPGKRALLTLTVTNPDGFAIKVTSIQTTVTSPSAHCAGANVIVSHFTGNAVVSARSSRKLAVQVTMRRGTPNACQGRVFPFHYRGVAKKG